MRRNKAPELTGDIFSGVVPSAEPAGICPVCRTILHNGNCVNLTCPRVNKAVIPQSADTVYPTTDRALARNIDRNTSHAAAATVTPFLPLLEGKVLDALNKRGKKGGTCDEIASDLNAEKTTISPRFVPLQRKGLIHDSGTTRAGRSGRSMTVWVYGKEPQ